MRSGSSENDASGAIGGAEAGRGQVVGPPEGIDQRRFGQREGHGVDREVPPGEISLDGVGELDVRLAGPSGVGIGAMGGDLEVPAVPATTDGAEPLPL